jgi:zinc protease
VPTDTAAIMEKAFQILEDWAHNVTFDDTEIDKERGVVIEEWRGGRGADARIRDRQFPILYHDSRYAVRLPIGEKGVLDTFHHETLRQFYRDWYRPDLMAVIAVGDFDRARVEKLIRDHFSRIPAPVNPRTREQFPVPDHNETLFAIASDPEATRAGVSVYYKHPPSPKGTGNDYRRRIVAQLYNSMLNQRLYELSQRPDPPFQFAYSTRSSMTPTADFYILGAAVNEDKILQGLDVILTEAARVRRHGFTRSELERQKVEFMRAFEQAYDEREKTESSSYMEEYTANFLDGEPAPGIKLEYELMKNILPGITLDEVNRLSSELITDANRVVSVSAPQKPGLVVPDEAALRGVFAAVEKKEIAPYEDRVTSEPLMAIPPAPGTLVQEKSDKALGTLDWKLSNGVRVVLKPTDFKNDEVLFAAFSPGGTSLVSDSDFISASAATSIVNEGGIGKFDQITLQKMLAGKAVGVSPYISELNEGLSGSASPKDLETMFQLVNLYFTAPRFDSSAFLSLKSRMQGSLKNRSARPESAFGDTLQATLSQYNYRRRPWTGETVERIDPIRAFEIYRDRFADASDFTFVIVGSFDPEKIRPLVLEYLGSLPSTKRVESWRDLGINPPAGVIEKTVRRGTEPKSRVQIIFTGPFEWTRQNRAQLRAVADVLDITLRESLREEKGGTYGVGVYGAPSKLPHPQYSFTVSFGCDPGRVQELTQEVFRQIDSLKKFGPAAVNLAKIKETARRERETSLKENQFWLGQLQYRLSSGEDPADILTEDQAVEGLTAEGIQKAAQRYLNTGNYVKVVLLPEGK